MQKQFPFQPEGEFVDSLHAALGEVVSGMGENDFRKLAGGSAPMLPFILSLTRTGREVVRNSLNLPVGVESQLEELDEQDLRLTHIRAVIDPFNQTDGLKDSEEVPSEVFRDFFRGFASALEAASGHEKIQGRFGHPFTPPPADWAPFFQELANQVESSGHFQWAHSMGNFGAFLSFAGSVNEWQITKLLTQNFTSQAVETYWRRVETVHRVLEDSMQDLVEGMALESVSEGLGGESDVGELGGPPVGEDELSGPGTKAPQLTEPPPPDPKMVAAAEKAEAEGIVSPWNEVSPAAIVLFRTELDEKLNGGDELASSDMRRMVKLGFLTSEQADGRYGGFCRRFLLEKGGDMITKGHLGWWGRCLGLVGEMNQAGIPFGNEVDPLLNEGVLPGGEGQTVGGGLKGLITERLLASFDHGLWSINANLPGDIEDLSAAGWMDDGLKKFLQAKMDEKWEERVDPKPREPLKPEEMPPGWAGFLSGIRQDAARIADETLKLREEQAKRDNRMADSIPPAELAARDQEGAQERDNLEMIRDGKTPPTPQYKLTYLDLFELAQLTHARLDMSKYLAGREGEIRSSLDEQVASGSWGQVGRTLWSAKRAGLDTFCTFCLGEEAEGGTWGAHVVEALKDKSAYDAEILYDLGLLTPTQP